MRSYQILTTVGALFTIYDLIFAVRQISISVLTVSIFAIISMFLFSNHTKAIGIGLIVLTASYILVPSSFNLLIFRPLEMIIFGVAAATALRYKNKI
jgi:hypothetical protein